MVPSFDRYQRQMGLPGWGRDAQERLRHSSVLVAGLGGLGSAVATNLVLAGVGRLRICDADTVDVTNLNRQFLHKEGSIGSRKASSAMDTLASLNSGVEIEPVSSCIDAGNVAEIAGGMSIIVDCLDNFEGRYVLNRWAVEAGIPLVHGAVWGLEGRVTFMAPPRTPCLACIFPNAPPAGSVPVLGAASCAIGSLQAMEAVKYIVGQGRLLEGRMLIFDGATMRFCELELRRNSQCPVCGRVGHGKNRLPGGSGKASSV